MLDAIALSDIHLGSDHCEAKALTRLLDEIVSGTVQVRRLILNGDVFDSCDFRRLKRSHWRVLSRLRTLSDQIEILWIRGNHDGPAELFSHVLGVAVQDEYILKSGGKRILFHHGHRFDDFIDDHPIVTALADAFYKFLQRVDNTHQIARLAKRSSKTFLRCSQKIESRSLELAASQACEIVCCGHTHLASTHTDGCFSYWNSGCWTEKPCHYLTVNNGVVALHAYEHPQHEDVGRAAANWEHHSSRMVSPAS